jgi:carboxypeptidase C (cathepsin A)
MPILSTVGHLPFPLRKRTLTSVIAVDQPVGTGFSYGGTDKYIKELKDVRFPP